MTRLQRWFATQRDLRRRIRHLEADNFGLQVANRKLDNDLYWALDAAQCVDPTRHIRLAASLQRAEAKLQEQDGDAHAASLSLVPLEVEA